jgi:purine catabolism regulator
MSLTVRELTEIPYLRTHLHAGESGASRQITWAHSIELPRPWEWLEEGDLLMTVGLGIPADARDQVLYVEHLTRAGASGVAIAEHMHAPPLSPDMIAAADEQALALLYTAYEVPLVQVSRAVAAANRTLEHSRLVKAVRVYDQVRAAVVRSSGPAELLHALESETGSRLFVCDNDRGRSLLPGSSDPPGAVREALLAALAERAGVLPGILRLTVGTDAALVVPVPARRPSSLLALPKTEAPAFAILQHVATVAALEVERLWASREELRRLGSETLANVLESRISPAAAAQQVRTHGLEEGPFVLLAASCEEGLLENGQLHHTLAERGIPNLLLRRGSVLYALLPADGENIATVLGALDESLCVGVSDNFHDLDAVPTAAREARWALDAATSEGLRVARYGEHESLFGPRSLVEAQMAVERVLGAAVAYDAEHHTELVRSLAVFLRCNRSWQKATAELCVHKQTLVYRMRRVEELTGHRLNETSDIAELWLAVKALEQLSWPSPSPSTSHRRAVAHRFYV